ncbi:MAG: PKD domain-containing protein [Flavobacteriales bacterium]|nr:PKD domain-containing protein [Flavobacteriales bacterium]
MLLSVLARIPMGRSIAAAITLSGALSAGAQQIITLGTGTQTNDPNQYPAPYGNDQPGSRHQIVVLASELNALGMGQGDIVSLAFDVSAVNGTPLQGFTLSIGTTSEVEAQIPWIAGTNPVLGPVDYTEVSGWNTHVFDTPFAWDGISNLVLQTCFSNGSSTNNASFFFTPTAFNSVVFRATPNGNVCTSNMGGLLQLSPNRPNMQFGYVPPIAIPVAGFSVSPSVSCNGIVNFSDGTTGIPDQWHWEFGDGDTSMVQDPSHAYLVDGTYTVQLIATNVLGSDTTTGTVTINMNGPQPASACSVTSPGTVAGFGITNVSFGDVNVNSADAVTEGYADRGCIMDTVLAGSSFLLGVTCGTITTHNVKAWIDWDNSGTFDPLEEIASSVSVSGISATVNVPATPVLNTPLRMRVVADYDFSPLPQPCTDPQYGQTEDYGIVVLENPLPPDAAISASPLFSCDGVVQFSDASLNAPTGWTWDFGDGNGSNDQNPVHTYLASGTYTVSLIAINPNGSDTETQTGLITIDLNGQTAAPVCIPQTQSWCCGYGILGVDFAGISNTSIDGSEGYQDRTCGNQANVTEGNSYPISVTTGDQNDCDTYVWLDVNGDGDFTSNELIFSALGTTSPAGNAYIPASSATGVPVRMRVSVDVVGELGGPCDAPLFGQTEDYSVIITAITVAPTADFIADPLVTCTGIVTFTDQSFNLPLNWAWDFGDGNNSTDQDPVHIYTAPGIYTVSLTTGNGNGTDTETQVDLIEVLPTAACDTNIVDGQQDQTNTNCTGILTDDGGPDDDYSPGQSGFYTIAPTIPAQVTLTFLEFEFEPNDSLVLFDGPDQFSPLIGSYNGNDVNDLPNNGVFTSTNGALTVWQNASNGNFVLAGFVATWTCSPDGISETTIQDFRMWPSPAEDLVNIDLQAGVGGSTWLTIQNTLGANVLERQLNAGAQRTIIDVGHWPTGLYAVTIGNNEGRITKKLVVR